MTLPSLETFTELVKLYTGLAKMFPRRKPFPVLLADDCERDRVRVSRLLHQLGMEHEVVESIDGARASIRHGQFGLMLMDIVFDHDRMAGIEFFNEIKADRPNLKVVFLSGYTENLDHSTVGHTIMSINKNMSDDSVKAAISEAVVLNGGFHASPSDIRPVVLFLLVVVAILGRAFLPSGQQVVHWIKQLL